MSANTIDTSGMTVTQGTEGDDILTGGSSADRFYFNRGDGVDTITNMQPGSSLVLEYGITLSDLTFSRVGDDTILTLLEDGQPTADQIIITGLHMDNLDGQRLVITDSIGQEFDSTLQYFISNKTWKKYDSMFSGHVRAGDTGDNVLVGAEGATSIFWSDAGDDQMSGSTARDYYCFKRGDGHDVIRDNGDAQRAENEAYDDYIALDEGITLDDLRLTTSDHHSTSLTLKILENGEETGDQITLQYAQQDAFRIEKVRLADGTVVELNSLVLEHHGEGDASQLTGRAGFENAFYGGEGNDTLVGVSSTDHFYFNRGDGVDTITNMQPGSSLVLEHGITLSDLTFSRVGDDTILTLLEDGQPTADQIIITGLHMDNLDGQRLVITDSIGQEFDSTLQYFISNKTWKKYDSMFSGHVRAGDTGDNVLVGAEGATSIFWSDAGDDQMSGSTARDYYCFKRGDGHDVIRDNGDAQRAENEAYDDYIALDEGITLDDLRLTTSDHHSTSLTLKILENGEETGDQITLQYAQQDAFRIEKVLLADGTIVDLNSLIDNTIYGGEGNDTLTGTAEDDVIRGLGGDDTIDAGPQGGSDLLDGGEGNDTITLEAGTDTTVIAGLGDDKVTIGKNLSGGTYSVSVDGGEGKDYISGYENSALHLSGGEGNDTLTLRSLYGGNGVIGETTLEGGQGRDYISGSYKYAETAIYSRGDGYDTVKLRGFRNETDPARIDKIQFGEGIQQSDLKFSGDYYSGNLVCIIRDSGVGVGDLISTDTAVFEFFDGSVLDMSAAPFEQGGTDARNYIYGSMLDDIINAGGGDDVIKIKFSSDSHDVVDGGSGDDTFDVKGGNDIQMLGGEGNDSFTVSKQWSYTSNQILAEGGEGSDEFLAYGGSNVVLSGGAGDDVISLKTDSNITDRAVSTLNGGEGNDLINGSVVADLLIFNRGDGTDQVDLLGSVSDRQGDVDVIQFGEGITFADLRTESLASGGTALIVLDNGVDTGDRIVMDSTVTDSIELSGGTTYDIADLLIV